MYVAQSDNWCTDAPGGHVVRSSGHAMFLWLHVVRHKGGTQHSSEALSILYFMYHPIGQPPEEQPPEGQPEEQPAEEQLPEDLWTWGMMIIWIPETNQWCIHREEKLEDPVGRALGLWITALMPAPPARWVDILPKIPNFKFFIQFKAIFLAKVVVIKWKILRKICQKKYPDKTQCLAE